MDLPLHVEPPARPAMARWIPSVRAVALLALGVGIGVVAAVPLGSETTFPVVAAALAASGAAALAVIFPRSVGAIALADILLGVAVIASVFGGLGPLYVPLLLAFFAVTARAERPAKRAGAAIRWRPAPEFAEPRRPSVAAPVRLPEQVWLPPFEPTVVRPARMTEPAGDAAWPPTDRAERPTWLAEREDAGFPYDDVAAEAEPDVAILGVAFTVNEILSESRIDVATAAAEERAAKADHQIGPAGLEAMRIVRIPAMDDEDIVVAATAAEVVAPKPPTDDKVQRPRPLPAPKRIVTAAVRAKRVLGVHARIGFGNLKDALTDAPAIDIVVPPSPATELAEGGPTERRLVVVPGGDREASA